MNKLINEEEIINKTLEFAKNYHLKDNTGHDYEHIKRVYNNSLKILQTENEADPFIVKMSSILHDIDDHKIKSNGHEAKDFLESINLNKMLIDRILDTINDISYSKSGDKPVFNTIEKMILSDADKLDAIGAIGVIRALQYGFSHNNCLFNDKIFPNEQYRRI